MKSSSTTSTGKHIQMLKPKFCVCHKLSSYSPSTFSYHSHFHINLHQVSSPHMNESSHKYNTKNKFKIITFLITN
jgi:hypothetical protein